MYFRNNEMGKSLPQETKPTPFPRTISGDTSPPTAPSVNTLNRNCHEFVNDEHHSFRPMTAINLASAEVSGFSDDEIDDTDRDDFSNDPHQRLIL
jgi:hypothetical protein